MIKLLSKTATAVLTGVMLVMAASAVLAATNSAPLHACSAVTIPAAAPKDVSIANGLAYMKTAQYRREFNHAIESARQEVRKHLGEPNIAIVVDIDETLLDNSPYYRLHPGGYDARSWHAWVDSGRAPALKPTARFVAWARAHHVAVFLVTGRGSQERASTIKNLLNDGIAYDGLYMRPSGNPARAETVKAELRQQITSMGFTIVVNIGDQYSDLAGPYGLDCEKLPNKMYFVP
jgi:5'-nucleotidase (lipoprotein e(P4) family)